MYGQLGPGQAKGKLGTYKCVLIYGVYYKHVTFF